MHRIKIIRTFHSSRVFSKCSFFACWIVEKPHSHSTYTCVFYFMEHTYRFTQAYTTKQSAKRMCQFVCWLVGWLVGWLAGLVAGFICVCIYESLPHKCANICQRTFWWWFQKADAISFPLISSISHTRLPLEKQCIIK